MNKSFLGIVGPTASGKTEVAIELAKRLPAEMISCDSMQVYRGMPITTQAPSDKTIRAKKIHLCSFLDVSKEYNAALFRKDAERLIGEIHAKGKVPLIVGGTGLYLRSLLDGLFESEGDSPSYDLDYRKKLLSLHEKHGMPFLHEKLQKIDAVSAKKIHPNDARRIIRALEVFHLTKEPLSQRQPKRQGIRNQYPHQIFFLDRNREDLYDRINRRVDIMFKKGLVREVKGLLKKKLSRTAACAIGIPEVQAYLSKEKTLAECKELLKQHTRNYAKRQLSWFRHEKALTMIPINPTENASSVAARIFKMLE